MNLYLTEDKNWKSVISIKAHPEAQAIANKFLGLKGSKSDSKKIKIVFVDHVLMKAFWKLLLMSNN